MKHKGTIYLLLVILLIGTSGLFAQERKEEVHWQSFSDAIDSNKKQRKKILVYIYSDNCGWCKKMAMEVFSDTGVAEYINDKYYAVRLNKDISEPVSYDERIFKFIPPDPGKALSGYHELVFLLLEGRYAFPSIACIDEDLVYIGVERGYKNPESFMEWLRYIAEDGYKTQTMPHPEN